MAIYLPILTAVLVGVSAGGRALRRRDLGRGDQPSCCSWRCATAGSSPRSWTPPTARCSCSRCSGPRCSWPGSPSAMQVSAAVGAFLLGIADLRVDRPERGPKLLEPLRDLFAAVFFVVFGLNTDPAAIPPVLGWAVVLAVATTLTKVATGWWAAGRQGIGRSAGPRAGPRWWRAASSRSSSPGWPSATGGGRRARRARHHLRAAHGRDRAGRGTGGGARRPLGTRRRPPRARPVRRQHPPPGDPRADPRRPRRPTTWSPDADSSTRRTATRVHVAAGVRRASRLAVAAEH